MTKDKATDALRAGIPPIRDGAAKSTTLKGSPAKSKRLLHRKAFEYHCVMGLGHATYKRLTMICRLRPTSKVAAVQKVALSHSAKS